MGLIPAIEQGLFIWEKSDKKISRNYFVFFRILGNSQGHINFHFEANDFPGSIAVAIVLPPHPIYLYPWLEKKKNPGPVEICALQSRWVARCAYQLANSWVSIHDLTLVGGQGEVLQGKGMHSVLSQPPDL